MTEHAQDNALADLVEAFGHYSESELQAFLALMPIAEAQPAVPVGDRVVFDWSASASVATRESGSVVQAVRA